MNVARDPIVLTGCNTEKVLRSFSGTHRCGTNSKISKLDEFPVLTKSEPISFSLTATRKSRLPSPVTFESNYHFGKSRQINALSKRKVKHGSKTVSDCDGSFKCSKNQCNAKSAPQTLTEDVIRPTRVLLPGTSQSYTVSQRSAPARTGDEEFIDLDLKSYSDQGCPTASSLSTEPPHSLVVAVRDTTPCSSKQFSSDRPRLDSVSDSSTGVGIFGSPDMPNLWGNNKPNSHPIEATGHRNRQPVDHPTKSPPNPLQLYNDTGEDDMEGTDLLHLISNSLDRFNAIVHPDDLSSSTSGVGTSVDGCCAGADLLSSGSMDDFDSSGFGSLAEQPAGQFALDQLMCKSTEGDFSAVPDAWLMTNYSTSCPSGTRSTERGKPEDSTLLDTLGSVVDLNPSTIVHPNLSDPSTLLPTETSQYIRDLGTNANKANPPNMSDMLNISSSLCALASSLLDRDSSHVTTPVKSVSATESHDNGTFKTVTSGPTNLTTLPGFATSWTDLFLGQTCHQDDNNSSVRRRESVLASLQSNSLDWLGLNNASLDWTTHGDRVTPAHSIYSDKLAFESVSIGPTNKGDLDADFQQTRTFTRPVLNGCGRSRLLSSCLLSDFETKHGALNVSDLGPCGQLTNANRYPELSSSEWNVSNLQKEFSEALRFVIPAPSINHRGSSDISGLSLSNGVQNFHSPSTPNTTPTPLVHLLSAAAAAAAAAALPSASSSRHVIPQPSNVKSSGDAKSHDPIRPSNGLHYKRCNHVNLSAGSLGRSSEFPFFRPRHASLNGSANMRSVGAPSSNSSGIRVPPLGSCCSPNSAKSGSTPEPTEANNGKPVIAKWRRACSFYLRGHCKKEDCEFAHDLTKVTCKFWEMGECFKGATCPFLHGYPPELTVSE